MKISLYQLRRIIATQLPKPGSINFDNCANKVEVPIFKTTGWMELAVEEDPSGMESGGHQAINELVGTLVFHKDGKDWELEYFNKAEIEYAIREAINRTRAMIKDEGWQLVKKEPLIKGKWKTGGNQEKKNK